MDEIYLFSSQLHRSSSEIIGEEPIIMMRRRLMNLENRVNYVYNKIDQFTEEMIFSGSCGEGFRFPTSDEDLMYVHRGVRAVFTLSQCSMSDNEQTLLLAETDLTKPGFVLLRLIPDKTDSWVLESCIKLGHNYYLSNDLWLKNGIEKFWTGSYRHGPCATKIIGVIETDSADCIKSNYFPVACHPSLWNLYKAGQLSCETFKKILKNGCHFVAISSKRPVHEELEWRISFSAVEKAIIHSMNYTQFLCYGLLKIFLQEAINVKSDLQGLLCSYFMITLVFWKLLDTSLHWNPNNFLLCFWDCLQVLVKWVSLDYCPNFFIPENNMFADKFTKPQQIRLLRHLSELYSEGYTCLFKCPSLSEHFSKIERSMTGLWTFSNLIPKLVLNTVREIWNLKPYVVHPDLYAMYFDCLEELLTDEEGTHESIKIWKFMLIAPFLCTFAFKQNIQGQNKMQYNLGRKVFPTMKVCSVDAISYLVYIAIQLYREIRYETTLCVLNKATSRLQNPMSMYPWTLNVRHFAAAGETGPILNIMREVVAFPLLLRIETCIPELYLEHKVAEHHSVDNIVIPPLVCIKLLYFLCYNRLQMFDAAASELQELSMVLFFDNLYHVTERDRAISWEILGICQEMHGDDQDAYYSFCTALRQKWCKIESAAVSRLIHVYYKMKASNQ